MIATNINTVLTIFIFQNNTEAWRNEELVHIEEVSIYQYLKKKYFKSNYIGSLKQKAARKVSLLPRVYKSTFNLSHQILE